MVICQVGSINRSEERFSRNAETDLLADHYVVMERGAVVATGLGKDMEANGVRRLVAI